MSIYLMLRKRNYKCFISTILELRSFDPGLSKFYGCLALLISVFDQLSIFKVADKYKVVSFLPKLKLLDGKVGVSI